VRELGPPAEHARAAAAELRPDLRSFPFKGYVIFLRYLDDDILQVVHTIEGHRDVAAIFARDDRVQKLKRDDFRFVHSLSLRSSWRIRLG
jgi:hypothetical protein